MVRADRCRRGRARAAISGLATCLDFVGMETRSAARGRSRRPTARRLQVCMNNQKVAIAPWNLDCRVQATVCDPPNCQ